ncbi:hypothetical protein F8M41_001497 [Gigaspora margarita]|uniref:Uncharacterized protein n=1 Tax=Gigaspora margarita TaxID=4874 RepID=A0A8H3XED1_GIGMA|nr:hypothetical protein F8M41_001497 [Gigaspora margarita]
MTQEGIDVTHNLPHDDQQISDDEHESYNENSTSFIPMGEMVKLPNKIYKKNKLPNEVRQHLLQTFPRNALIKFAPPPMDKELAKRMRKEAKDIDKTLQRVSYRSFSVLRPSIMQFAHYIKLNQISRMNKLQKPGSIWNCHYLQQEHYYWIPYHISEQREEHAIKCIYPTHQPKSEVDLLFANKLKDVIKAKNEETKFFNDAVWQNKHAQLNQTGYKHKPLQQNKFNK